jgi:hypothetical protein
MVAVHPQVCPTLDGDVHPTVRNMTSARVCHVAGGRQRHRQKAMTVDACTVSPCR